MDDILKIIPRDHPAHSWVEFMINSPDMFQRDAMGRWMAIVDWSPSEGYLVTLDADGPQIPEELVDGLWETGRARRDSYLVVGPDMLLRVYAEGERMFGQDWDPSNLRLVDRAAQKVILGRIEHE